MAKTSSHRIADKLYLVNQTPNVQAVPQPVPSPTNHLVVIDCSGSMSGELPAIREQLKKKLPRLLAEQDTLSIIWFSGKGQSGVLVENEPVATLADLQDVEKAVDRWLKPVGLTGFRDPLMEVEKLVGKISQSRPDSVFSLFFMSDGCDNQYSRTDILDAVVKASGSLASSTFVEYGYYADRPTLTAMAEKAGGSLIFAKDFDSYQPVFEAAMAKKIMGGKRVELEIRGDAVCGFAFGMADQDLVTFEVGAGKIWIPEALTEGVWYLSPVAVGDVEGDLTTLCGGGSDTGAVGAAYAALSLYAARMKPDVVLNLLRATGDVRFIEKFGGLFGKQKYSEFMDAAKEAAFDKSARLKEGYDPRKVPLENGFTALEFLRLLADDEGNRVLLDHSAFQYQRIGRGRVDASQVLTADEQAEVARLTSEMTQTKDAKKIAELAGQIAALSAKQDALKFEADEAPDGYPVSSLTYNEERPNISMLVKKPGTVDLSGRNPSHGIPAKFPTFVYRNYTIIKDGIVNVKTLPCLLTDKTRDLVAAAIGEGRATTDFLTFESQDGRQLVLVHLDKLPVINRQMVKDVSAKSFFERQYTLTRLQAEAKVYNSIKKEMFPRKSEGFTALYSDDGANWLKEQGFTDYSGFSPKAVQAESTDFYLGKELKVSLKGLSSLPTLKVARENIAKGKVNAPTALMKTAIEKVDAFLASDAYKTSAVQETLFEVWLDGEAKTASAAARRLQREIAEDVLTLVVGQTWFTEFKSLDENTMTITVDGQNVEGKIEMREVEVKI